jgi:hypothetical protein
MFTFIAYKESTENIYRENFSSDFRIENNLNDNGVTSLWGEYLFKDKVKEYGEGSYCFHILLDGIMVFYEDHIYWDGEYSEEEVNRSRIQGIWDKALVHADYLYQKDLKVKKDAEEAKIKYRQTIEQEQRRKEYEKLKKEFNDAV